MDRKVWIQEEYELFRTAHHLKNVGDYELSLELVDQLLAKIKGKPGPTAYVLGCIKAVNLRHLGRREAAEETFDSAYRMALEANEPVIAAYMLNDQASMYSAKQAKELSRQAIAILKKEESTPDPERSLPADLAYFEATSARQEGRLGISGAYEHMAYARYTLCSHARRLPRYKDAYLLVLGWEWQMHRPFSLDGMICLGRAAFTAARQGKLKVLIKLLLSIQRKRMKSRTKE